MNIIISDLYESLASQFQREQIRMLKAVLEKNGLDRETSKKICEEYSFNFAVFLDQGEVEFGEDSYRPTVAFTADEETYFAQPLEVEYHAYALGTSDEVFSSE